MTGYTHTNEIKHLDRNQIEEYSELFNPPTLPPVLLAPHTNSDPTDRAPVDHRLEHQNYPSQFPNGVRLIGCKLLINRG